MRKAFVETLIELARQDPRVVLLTADLGFAMLEPFASEFPQRFFNVGVAEQNMMGLATGLAKEGFIPFVYSMGTFSALRPYEVIRNGPILHQLPVRIIGIGGGFDYGTAGSTHHSLEDIAVLRTQPGIHIFSPADSSQARAVIKGTWLLDGPIYYRLSKDERPDIIGLNGRFDKDTVQEIQNGQDLCLITTGRISEDVLLAAAELRERHALTCSVLLVASLNPGPSADLRDRLKNFSKTITVETHFIRGGLGSLVAEVIADNQLNCRLLRMGVDEIARAEGGDAAHLNARHGLSKDGIIKAALNFVGTKNR